MGSDPFVATLARVARAVAEREAAEEAAPRTNRAPNKPVLDRPTTLKSTPDGPPRLEGGRSIR
jgi:hypothetical protein